MNATASLLSRLTLPVIGSPLFIISTPKLVTAQCKSGIVGSFPALNARPAHLLDTWLSEIRDDLATFQTAHPDRKVAPFAVNQICHPSNDRLMQDMETCVRHRVPIIITSLSASREVVDAAHSYGGLVLHDVISIRHAESALRHGVDGLILVCAGAGGHAESFCLDCRGAALFRWTARPGGLDCDRRRYPRGAGHGSRFRLYGHALHRD